MSVHLIEEDTSLGAWQTGCRLLLDSGNEVTNLITTIIHPCVHRHEWMTDYSPDRVKTGADNVRDVANTLFPQRIYERTNDRDELYSRYLSVHDRARSMPGRHRAWGTYFERLIRFPPNGINQLELAIRKLNTWSQRSTTGLVFHLSSAAMDAPRPRGNPCWQFAEILWNSDNSLDLVAVYRNHDYFNKVFGNFVGLGHLLNFIAKSSNKTSGKLICHSVHAYFDCSRQQLRTMIK